MALTAVQVNPPADAYLGGLRAVIASVSPALLDRDRWGFQTLKEVVALTRHHTFIVEATRGQSGFPSGRAQIKSRPTFFCVELVMTSPSFPNHFGPN
ncbi:hypothetical protein [Azospirillum rugosum]|uniref:Uncharacterized protein n=1 Tax=Azospirillum rugosum TaxID=416170 RepID=A0ABS4SXM9_9PROT|nr:hypothetical protein [Azospirillum rugosum]MBP2297305.1 hypothetical protein [Azospirillum rugosum]MDQ0531153.1 hypothetical protein [Azospirillum rugosum]